ncbi:MAG: UbiD family decarboxylase [Desulfobacterales bacterium]|nr:UbiD family decarboxylase [Desulfobacterales bacterium]
MRGYRDLRHLLQVLRDQGELHEINVGVDHEWEVGAICRENDDRFGPALMFNKISTFTTPLVAGIFATLRRYGIALGLPDLDGKEKFDAAASLWNEAYLNPVAPRQVSEAPCKEVFIGEDKVNLWSDPFPVPRWHPLDGGYMLGTLHAVITKDPDTGWHNCGTYRNQILNEKRLWQSTQKGRHNWIHFEKYRALGKPMPVAIALGLDPALAVTCVTPVPRDVDEYSVAGGLRGEPLELIRAETSDLLVPARAEIIIEGEIPTNEEDRIPGEGPFGEFAGYQGFTKGPREYINIKAITHRRDPIFQGTLEGRPPNESTVMRGIGRSMALKEHLRRVGVLGIIDVCVTMGGASQFHAVVAIHKSYPGHVREVMANVWGHPNMAVKHVVVVDEDIDPWNSQKVEWAIATRVQAGRDVEIVKDGRTVILDPSQPISKRVWSDLMGIDATRPEREYEAEGETFPPLADPTPEQLKKVQNRWKQYGF